MLPWDAIRSKSIRCDECRLYDVALRHTPETFWCGGRLTQSAKPRNNHVNKWGTTMETMILMVGWAARR